MQKSASFGYDVRLQCLEPAMTMAWGWAGWISAIADYRCPAYGSIASKQLR